MIITNLDWHIENQRSIEHCGPYHKETNPNSRWYEPTEAEEEYEYYLELQYRAGDIGYELFEIDGDYQITKDSKHLLFIPTINKVAEWLNDIDGKDTAANEWLDKILREQDERDKAGYGDIPF